MEQFTSRFHRVAEGVPNNGFWKGLLTAMLQLGAFVGMLCYTIYSHHERVAHPLIRCAEPGMDCGQVLAQVLNHHRCFCLHDWYCTASRISQLRYAYRCAHNWWHRDRPVRGLSCRVRQS